MPTLDVNGAFDPSFYDTITVNRYVETIDQNGRAVRTLTQIPNVQAVIVAATPNDLLRLPEEEHTNKAIKITAPFRFQGNTIDASGNRMHPDEIPWHGSTFVVRDVEDYSGYGRGFTMVVCTSVGPIDGPPLPQPTTQASGRA